MIMIKVLKMTVAGLSPKVRLGASFLPLVYLFCSWFPAFFINCAIWAQNKDSGLSVKQVEVPASAGWVDTGLEVMEGEKYEFIASGSISCQQGNPVASCGPEGLDLQTVQQPLPDHNLGALVGKVVKLISIRKEEDSGEEIREEVVRIFFIGPHSEVEMPLAGKLYLGVNDNVYADNDGKFNVSIFKK
ncbi:MAG TPA: hypothetical protein P5517_06045 [Candidatus Saccharicenans sp.]|nr:hypothetical protein [Candidatus Saccharicenans sp.]